MRQIQRKILPCTYISNHFQLLRQVIAQKGIYPILLPQLEAAIFKYHLIHGPLPLTLLVRPDNIMFQNVLSVSVPYPRTYPLILHTLLSVCFFTLSYAVFPALPLPHCAHILLSAHVKYLNGQFPQKRGASAKRQRSSLLLFPNILRFLRMQFSCRSPRMAVS